MDIRQDQTTMTLKSCKKLLLITLTLLVALRVVMLSMVRELDTINYIRHGIYTLSWLAVLLFMFKCSMRLQNSIFKKEVLKDMKYISFITTIACIARVFVSAYYYWPIVTPAVGPSVHNILEICIWALLACFFGCYCVIRARQERNTPSN